MSMFKYRVCHKDTGRIERGISEASSATALAQFWKNNNCTVMNVEPVGIIARGMQFLKDIIKRWQRLSRTQLILLFNQLSMMLEAGINIRESINLIIRFNPQRRTRRFLEETLSKLEEGVPLSQAWHDNSYIPPYLLNIISIAEHTGLMAQAFKDSSKYLLQQNALYSKIRSLCIYPAFILIMLVIMLGIVIVFLLPVFNTMFTDMHVDLPLITRILLNFSVIIHQYGLFILLILLTLIIAWRYLQHSPRFIIEFSRYILKMPKIGSIIQMYYIVKFGSQLNLLLKAGINIREAIGIIQSGQCPLYLQRTLSNIQETITTGGNIYEAINRSGIDNVLFTQMIMLGENTGNLVECIDYAVNFIRQYLQQRLEESIKLLEPMLILLVGIIVGTVVLSIVVPLFEMISSPDMMM